MFFPALAMDKSPGLVCLSVKFSSVKHSQGKYAAYQATCLAKKKLTCKFHPVDRFTTRPIPIGEITTLQHKVGDYTVEGRPSVPKAVLVSSELAEIFGSLGNDIIKEPEDDAT